MTKVELDDYRNRCLDELNRSNEKEICDYFLDRETLHQRVTSPNTALTNEMRVCLKDAFEQNIVLKMLKYS
jgi:hypothetical protein